MVPYVMSEAYPRAYDPFVNHTYGVINIDEMHLFILHKMATDYSETYKSVCEYRKLKNKYIKNKYIKNISDLHRVYKFRDWGHPMNNPYWEFAVFINGEWEDLTPTEQEVIEYIKELNSDNTEDENENEDEDEDEDEDESSDEDDCY